MATDPVRVRRPIKFGDGFELDEAGYELRRAGIPVKLEPTPFGILSLLIEQSGQLVSRQEIVERVWGNGVFLDTDNSINGGIRKIRQALNDDPENPRFIQTVTGRGYRFIAPLVETEPDTPAAARLAVVQPASAEKTIKPAANLDPNAKPPSDFVSELDGWLQSRKLRLEQDDRGLTAETLTQAEIPRGRKLSRRLLLVVLASCLLLAITYSAVRWRRAQTTGLKLKSLAVLPLKNLAGDPSQDYLADGLTEELIGRLADLRELRVISRTSVMRFKDTQLSVPEIAKMLGVDAIVEGSVMRDGSRIRVHAQLIRAANDEHFWSETYDRELRDVLSLESDIARAIAGKVEVSVSGKERERLTAAHPVAPEVFENYLKGLHAFSARELTQSVITQGIGYFDEAIRRDPTFAPAYLSLAYAYDLLGSNYIGGRPQEMLPKEMNAARRAIEIDPNLAEAHSLLGYVQQRQYRWAEAKAEYQRAFELNPNSADVHDRLAQWFLSQGQTEEALAWERRGRELDPIMISGADVGLILFCAHRYDEAKQEVRSVLAVDPNDANALWTLGFILVANHQPAEAIAVLEKVLAHSERSPGVIGTLINAYAQAGRRAQGLRLLAELKEKQKQTGFVPAGAFVNAYLGLREDDQAFAWLEQAYQEQSNLLQTLKVHPFFDPIRSDPRFADLLRRAGLDQAP